VTSINPTSVHWIIRFAGNAGVSSQAATVPEFKNALQLIWFTLPEKAIDNVVKDYCRYVCQPTVEF